MTSATIRSDHRAKTATARSSVNNGGRIQLFQNSSHMRRQNAPLFRRTKISSQDNDLTKRKIRDELQRLVDAGIIVPVDEPTDWVSQMSVAEKKAGIRICIDPRPLNEALKREHYKLPTLEDVLPDLTKAKVFSVCDLKSGYLHCELDHASSLLTTFATPFGRYRWLRLPFGLKVSSEIFQKRLHHALEGLEGVRCIADDVIIWGRTDEEHDARVCTFLKCCVDKGITLSKEKCRFGLNEIPFMGHVLTSDGLKPDPSKVEAVQKHGTSSRQSSSGKTKRNCELPV